MATQLQNTFKNGAEPVRHKSEIIITDKELAAYNYTRLKIAYQRDQTEAIIREIKSVGIRRIARYNKIVTRSVFGVVAAAVIGLIIKNIF